jgi:hypothetical protein
MLLEVSRMVVTAELGGTSRRANDICYEVLTFCMAINYGEKRILW